MTNTTSADPNTLVALQFDSGLRANEFVAAALRMESEGHLLIRDAVFVTKDNEGTAYVTETTDLTTGRGGWNGAAWGGLVGLLLGLPIAGMAVGAGIGSLQGRATDLGVSDEFVNSLEAAVEPGKTVLALLVSHIDEEAVGAELQRFPTVQLLTTDLPPEVTGTVADALAANR